MPNPRKPFRINVGFIIHEEPAEAMGLGADLGTIEPGKLADLVVVDGNPLANITDLRKTRTVIKDGTVYPVEALLKAVAPRP